ncbi:MAG: proteasome subunit beta [Nanopusillaceae archaeon]|jgi:proteasome beta subunit
MTENSGTTIVAIKFKDGIVLASDRQTTAGFMVYHKKTKKLHEITDKIIMGAAGLVGDIETLVKFLQTNLKLKKLKSKIDATAEEAANLLATLMNYYKWFPFFTEVIIAGKDEDGYNIYSIDEAGGLEKFDDFIATGSGMPFALGVLESEYKENMNEEEAKELAKKAVLSAIKRDLGSGYGVEIWVLTDKGLEKEIYEIKEEIKQK